MRVKPMLGDWKIPRIELIRTLERRAFAELAVPGRAGSLFQDLNTTPTRIAISGSLYGDEARDEFLQRLRGKFSAGEPVTFVADIVTATEVQYVIIEALRFQESGSNPDQTDYHFVIRESPAPPGPPDPLGALDTGVLEQADGFLDSVTGALDVIHALGAVTLGAIPDIVDPTPPLTQALDGVQGATDGLDVLATDLRNLFGA